MYYTNFQSPVGPLLLAADDRGLCFVSFSGNRRAVHAERTWKRDQAPFKETIRQLQAYFRGELKEFNLPLALEGTPFQRSVWKNLLAIPYGKTISYGQLADRIGRPKAVRAVGLANGQNPLPIIIPCHRVIGSNGKLTGYGGGLPFKEKLLALESRQLRLL